MDGTPQEITNLVGREVYSNNGVFVGEVRDVHLDFERQTVTELALQDLNDELFHGRIDPGKGVMVPYRWVRAVGERCARREFGTGSLRLRTRSCFRSSNPRPVPGTASGGPPPRSVAAAC